MRLGGLVVMLVVGMRGAIAQPAAEEPPVQEIEPEPPETTVAPAPAPTTPPVSHAAPVHTMDELTIPTSFLRFGINFFADSGLAVTTRSPRTSFMIGTLGVRMLGQLSSSLDALGELAFETTDGRALADIEQVALRWRTAPGVLELGRFHTNLGYWNTAYHHGLWLQVPIARPHALRFEDDGGLLPVHWVGGQYTLVTGTVATSFAVGNGRGDVVDDILVAADNNTAKALLLKSRIKTERIEAGATVIYDLIAAADAMIRPALPRQRIHEVIGNAYFVLRGDGPIVVAESFAIRHQTTSQSWTTYALYGLVGYAISERFTVYGAGDAVTGADDDPFFRPDPVMSPSADIVEVLVGARYDTSTWSALKLELQLEHRMNDGDDYTSIVNWAFGL